MAKPRMKSCTMLIGWPQGRQMKVADGLVAAAACLSSAVGSAVIGKSSRTNARLTLRNSLASSP
jgi:hypothetical protein